jgi:hypothetical protein
LSQTSPSIGASSTYAGEQARVRLAEHAAPGQPDVGELLVADRLAQEVHVARGVGGREAGEEVGVAVQARAGDRLRAAEERVQVERVRRRQAERADRVAVDRRRAAADAARVEADPVEAGDQLERGRWSGAHELDGRHARPAVVQEQRTDPVVGVERSVADDRERTFAPT